MTNFSIEAHGLTKVYGGKAAVDNLSFGVTPGRVTGFLGPNGAGKSTTMRRRSGPAATRSGWRSGSVSPRRCSATRAW